MKPIFRGGRDAVGTVMLGAVCVYAVAFGAAAQDGTGTGSPPGAPSASPPPASAPPPANEGLLPIPDYSGELFERHFLTGDWGGARTDLANKGVQFTFDWTQYLQGVASGGRDNKTKYGGNGDYVLNLDLMRMGVLPGALVKVRAESRYGESVNAFAGPILPVNTQAFFPLTDDPEDDVPFTVTNVLYTQFLSPQFAAFLGKLDTLDGDPNEFASGRGSSQFMNANFVFNSATALRLPYSTLGAGVVWMPSKTVTFTTSIINTADSSTTTGFEDFGDGMTWSAEGRVQYRLWDLPGGMNLGGLYSFDQEFAHLNPRIVLQPGQGLTRPTSDDTWAVYWSGWQYLWVEDPSEDPINAGDGVPDHQGVGVFARAGIADKDTNPTEWSVSCGVGGRGIFPTRDADTFGVGYYYADVQTLRISGIAGLQDHAQGFEMFYNVAFTPAVNLTFDMQVVESVTESVDTGVVLGARLNLAF